MKKNNDQLNSKSTEDNIEQQQINFNKDNTMYFNTSETQNEHNYKNILSKLISKSEISTEPFEVFLEEEGELKEDEEKQNQPIYINEPDDVDKIIIDDENKPSNMNSISVRKYSHATSIDDSTRFVYINKLKFTTLAIISLLGIIETGIMYFIINSINPIHAVFYYIAFLIALIPFGVGLINYAVNPNKKVKRKFSYGTYFFNIIIICILLYVILLVIVLLSSISLIDPTDYVPKIFLPAIYIFDIPIGLLIFMILEKRHAFNLKK